MRFAEPVEPTLTLQQIRGKEGIRVRQAYAKASQETGVQWSGRSYKREDWYSADNVNRALSAANSCLYGICHAAIVSAGYSPALGFIHTGKMLSFVYDIGDLYKANLTIPIAFAESAKGSENLEPRVRRSCRDKFRESSLLQRIIPDIERALSIGGATSMEEEMYDSSDNPPGGLWDPTLGDVDGGQNWAEE